LDFIARKRPTLEGEVLAANLRTGILATGFLRRRKIADQRGAGDFPGRNPEDQGGL